MKAENQVLEQSYRFALHIISLYQYLSSDKREFILSKQLLRCGTSIGANINEAQAAISKKDFIAKMSISSKEARETAYWLNLMADSQYIHKDSPKTATLFDEIESLQKLLTSIVKTSQNSNQIK